MSNLIKLGEVGGEKRKEGMKKEEGGVRKREGSRVEEKEEAVRRQEGNISPGFLLVVETFFAGFSSPD